MKGGKKKEEEEDKETRSEEREAESGSGGIETYRKTLESQLRIACARQERPPTAKADSTPLTEHQIDTLFKLIYHKKSFDEIMEVMGVNEGETDLRELELVMKGMAFGGFLQVPKGKHSFEKLYMRSGLTSKIGGKIHDKDVEFEAYDPVKWELAVEKETVDRDEEKVRLSRADELVRETSGIPYPPIVQDLKYL